VSLTSPPTIVYLSGNRVADLIEQEALTEQMTEAQALYKRIKDMELEMQRMRAAHPVENRMTIPQAETLVEQYEKEMIDSTTEADEAKEEIEVVRVKATKAAKDVQRLAKDREREEARAREVREGREDGDTRVDELCHWSVYITSLFL
jgi:chromosome segregation ATPase